MGSNILNMYHQTPYRNIGHKVLRSTSESGTSESSCNQNSPEYNQSQKTNEDDSDDGEYWNEHTKQQVWSQSEQVSVLKVNISKSNHDISYDENEQVDVQNTSMEERIPSSPEQVSDESVDGNSLVEGDDYDIIQVIAVDPDSDLASSDEEQDYCDGEYSDGSEYSNPKDDYRIEENHENQKADETPPLLCPNDLGINLDEPVVSNVDEYFIKNNDEKILEAKDEPVVKDVDEYFIKEPVVISSNAESAVDRSQYDQGIDFRITENIPTLDTEVKPKKKEIADEEEGLSNIEFLKRFILDDLNNDRVRNAPRTQNSVSLPQTPMHNVCMDIDAKTCYSFEDLDLSDLSFEQFKYKPGNNKNDDIPHTLTDEEINSFLITGKLDDIKPDIIDDIKPDISENIDDLTHQDMEIEKPLDTIIKCIETPVDLINTVPDRTFLATSSPKPILDIKSEVTDFVDIESCNEGSIPVLKANTLNSLLEQFEASEKLNTENVSEKNVKTSNSSRMRLQDAGIQLNKNKMRHILLPSTVNATITRSPSPIHADHDYCSTKKRHSESHLRGGQSLLKPDVLSSNNEILNSRHRSCKNKKIVYNLSSDDESDSKAKKKLNKSTKTSLKSKKPITKTSTSSIKSNTIQKIEESVLSDCSIEKGNNSVIVKSAGQASDICSQNNSGIKLIIKNKSEVILNNVDVKDNKNNNVIEKQSSISVDKVNKKSSIVEKGQKLDSVDNKDISSVVTESADKKDIDTNPENFYATLFTDKKDVRIPQNIIVENKEETKTKPQETNEQPAKKKKLNLQEYKLRRGGNSNASSAQVSPEAIFPETPNLQLEKSIISSQSNDNSNNLIKKEDNETPKTIFDPIREASRKIIMISKKQKVEALRKKEEEMLMRNIGKVETLEIQPLISDSEMMKIIGMTPEVIPVPIAAEKIQAPQDYDEVVLVSVGTNTDENMFKMLPKSPERTKRKSNSPSNDTKSNINFKIRKNDHLLKHNVFDLHRKESSGDSHEDNEGKIDKDRYKDITATLKSVEKQVETKISSNSLFASIQDVVMKKAPSTSKDSGSKHSPKRNTSVEKSPKIKTTIVREYDINSEHGEDKVILHLKKDTVKPKNKSEFCQTDPIAETKTVTPPPVPEEVPKPKKNRHDSDMSLSSEDIPAVTKKVTPPQRPEVKIAVVRPRIEPVREVQQKEKSRSDVRYDTKYRRSRSHSRGRRRNGSPSRKRSRSRDYRPYRRRESPYRRKQRSRSPKQSRSPRQRSRSPRQRSRSPRQRSRSPRQRSRSPRQRSRSPRQRSRSPRQRSRSPRQRSRSPRQRSRSPRQRSRSPRQRSRSPRQRSRSPRQRSRSPYHSRRSPRRDYKTNKTRSRSRHNDRIKSRTPLRKRQSSPKYNTNNYRPSNDKKPAVTQPQPVRKPTVSESSYTSSVSRCSSVSKSSTSSSNSSASSGSYRKDEAYRNKGYTSYSSEDRENNTPVEERRIVFVGKLEKDITKGALRTQFSKFGPVTEVRLHSKEDGSRYGFVTYQRPCDAWSAVENASLFPQYDVGFGGRRAFCRQSYADLDGLEAKYTESAFHGQPSLPIRRNDDMSFEQMLLDMKNKLNKRKGDKTRTDDSTA